MLKLQQAAHLLQEAGIPVVFHWRRSHMTHDRATRWGSGNDRVDDLADEGLLRSEPLIVAGAMELKEVEDPCAGKRKSKKVQRRRLGGVVRPPLADPEMKAGAEEEEEDLRLAASLRMAAESHAFWAPAKAPLRRTTQRSELRAMKVQSWLYHLQIGAEWNSGRPLENAKLKLEALLPQVSTQLFQHSGPVSYTHLTLPTKRIV